MSCQADLATGVINFEDLSITSSTLWSCTQVWRRPGHSCHHCVADCKEPEVGSWQIVFRRKLKRPGGVKAQYCTVGLGQMVRDPQLRFVKYIDVVWGVKIIAIHSWWCEVHTQCERTRSIEARAKLRSYHIASNCTDEGRRSISETKFCTELTFMR